MKSILISMLCMGLFFAVNGQEKQTQNSKKQIVKASCGTCNFGMEGKGCMLAVMIDGENYFVDGSDLHDHGDAHGHNGLCSKVRMAEVEGKVVDGRFQASSFKIIEKHQMIDGTDNDSEID